MYLRDSVLILRQAIAAEDLRLLTDYVRTARMVDSLVSDFAASEVTEDVNWVVDRAVRDTQEVALDDALRAKLRAIDAANIDAHINPFYAVKVRDAEPSQILHYGVGGHYIAHVDAETLYTDDIGLEMWEKTLDRDLSLVYFLNDDFTGGELFFPKLDLSIEPTAGTLVCFPSDHHFIHGVKPVSAGHRYTIVTWLRVTGMPTVDEINQQAMDEYHRAWPKQIEQAPRVAKAGVQVSLANVENRRVKSP